MTDISIIIVLPFFGSKIELDASGLTTIDELIEVAVIGNLPPDKSRHKFELYYKGALLQAHQTLKDAGMLIEAQPVVLDCVMDRATNEQPYIRVNVRYQGQKSMIEIDPHSLLIDLLVKNAKMFKIPLDNPQTKMHAFFRGNKLDNGQSLLMQGFGRSMDEEDYIDIFVEAIGGGANQ